MPFTVPKADLPNISFQPVKTKDGTTAMFGLVPGESGALLGPVILYVDSGECVFCTWDEIIEWAETAPRKEREKPKEPDKKVREVKNPQHN